MASALVSLGGEGVGDELAAAVVPLADTLAAAALEAAPVVGLVAVDVVACCTDDDEGSGVEDETLEDDVLEGATGSLILKYTDVAINWAEPTARAAS